MAGTKTTAALGLLLAVTAVSVSFGGTKPERVDSRLSRRELTYDSLELVPGVSSSEAARVTLAAEAGGVFAESLRRMLPDGTLWELSPLLKEAGRE